MTQLMFKICDEPPIDILTVNPTLPECLIGIINRALTIDVAERFQTGEEMAGSIRECAAALSTVDVAL